MNGGSIDLQGTNSIIGVRLGDPYSNNNYTFNMNNASINVHTEQVSGWSFPDTDTFGIFLDRGANVSVGNSSITASSTYNSYGIYVEGDREATITLSNNDAAVSEVTPVVKGNTYGIYRQAGTFNYYDGIIKGATQIYGGVSDRPESYELVYGTEGTLNTVVLRQTLLVLNTDTNEKYSSIQAAINACPNDSVCNLQLLYQAALSSQVTIPNTKNIVFDLNDLKITTSNSLNIVNNGEIKFTNGKLDSEGTQDFSGIIENNGILTIDDVVITDYDSTRSNLITNNSTGSVYIVSGTLKINGASDGGNRYTVQGTLIKNLGGYVEITNATMEARSVDNYGVTNGIYTGAVVPDDTQITTNYGSYNFNNNSMNFGWDYSEVAIPIDLSTYTGNVNVSFKANTTRTEYYMYAWITTTTTEPTSSVTPFASDETGQNYQATHDYSTQVAGGSTYYLHIKTRYYPSISSIIIEQNGEIVDLFKHGKTVIKNIDFKDYGNDAMVEVENGTLEIQGGTFYTAENGNSGIAVRSRGAGVINISSGTINNKNVGIILEGGSTLNATGGTISNDKGAFHGVRVYDSHVNANNLTITGNINNSNEQIAYIADGMADVNINNSTISINSTGTARGIHSEDYATVNVSNSTMTITGSNGSAGVYAKSANTYTIGNTTINSDGYGIFFEDHARGVINLSNSDGDDDQHVSTTLPFINSKREAIYGRDAKFNFYDGKLKGPVVYTYGINDVPEGYVINETIDGTYKVWTLVKSNIVLIVNNNTEYNTLQAAITACPNNTECTIKALDDFTIYRGATIPLNKEIVLDLNSKTVYSKDDKYITNNGLLTVKNGTMKVSVGINQHPIIENNNKLTLEGTSSFDSNDYIYSKLIVNNKNAELYVNGATLSNSEVEDSYHNAGVEGKTIYNNGGYVEINNATFNTTSKNPSVYLTSNPDIPTRHSGTFELKRINGSIENVGAGNYYIPIDLTAYSGTVNIDVDYSTLANANYKYYITDNNGLPTTLTTVDKTETEAKYNQHFDKDVQGGQVRVYLIEVK